MAIVPAAAPTFSPYSRSPSSLPFFPLSQSSLVPRVFMNFEFRYRESAERARRGRGSEQRDIEIRSRSSSRISIRRSLARAWPSFRFLRTIDRKRARFPRGVNGHPSREFTTGTTIGAVVLPVRLSGLLLCTLLLLLYILARTRPSALLINLAAQRARDGGRRDGRVFVREKERRRRVPCQRASQPSRHWGGREALQASHSTLLVY